jgi:hypothetical protein
MFLMVVLVVLLVSWLVFRGIGWRLPSYEP